jgi:hypothetical protein
LTALALTTAKRSSSAAVPPIYREAFDRCDRLYLTLIHADFAGDARFPDPATCQPAQRRTSA